jgi:hypothetical protein
MAGRAAGVADVFRTNPGAVTTATTVAVAVATIAGLAALWWSVRKSWPWLIAAGVLLTLPVEVADLMPSHSLTFGPDAAVVLLALRPAAAQLLLLGVLAAGTRLAWIGARGAGAFLIGAAFGAQVFGAATEMEVFRTLELREPGMDVTTLVRAALHYGMILAALGAAVLIMILHRVYDRRPELAGPDDSDPGPSRRTAIAGATAALVFIPAGLVWDDGQAYSRTGYAVLLAAGLVLAAVAGPRVLAGTAVATLVVAGISGPVGALIFMQGRTHVLMWFLVGVAVLAGAAFAYPARRGWSAAGACATGGLLLVTVIVVRPGWSAPKNDPVTLLLLAALVAAATTAIATVGAWLATDSAAPVVLGPLMTATVIGGCGLLAQWQGTGRRGPGRELFNEPLPLGAYAALLLTAGALLAASKLLDRRPL